MVASRKAFPVVVSLILLVFGLSSVRPITISGAGQQPVQNVSVVNTGAQPVPVTGGVTVSNLPATQQIAGAVSVDNFPATQTVAGTVNIGSMPVPPFQSPVGEVFRANVLMNGWIENPNPNVTGVPGHRLVIEVVDFNWSNAEVGILDIYRGSVLVNQTVHNLTMSSNGLAASAHALTKIYLDPGEKIQVRFDGSMNGQPSNGQAFVSGYFEP